MDEKTGAAVKQMLEKDHEVMVNLEAIYGAPCAHIVGELANLQNLVFVLKTAGVPEQIQDMALSTMAGIGIAVSQLSGKSHEDITKDVIALARGRRTDFQPPKEG